MVISILIFLGIILIIFLISLSNKPYTIEDYHSEVMKDYNEKRWIEYQETKKFKNSNK